MISLKWSFQIQWFGSNAVALSIFLATFLSGNSATAQQDVPELRVVTFGASVGFNDYLMRAAEETGVSCSSNCFADQNQANLVIVFAPSIGDTRFLPRIIYPVYQQLVQQDKSGSYFIRREVFNGTFSADVAIITSEEFEREYLEALKLDAVGDDRVSCIAAHSVFFSWLKNVPGGEFVEVRDQSILDNNLSEISAFEKLDSICGEFSK